MRRYGPRNRRINRGRFGLVICVAAAAVVVIVLCVVFLGGSKLPDEDQQQGAEGDQVVKNVFEPGITVGGVNVSGLSIEEGKAAVLKGIDEMLSNEKVEFTVKPAAKHSSQEAIEVEGDATGDGEEGSGGSDTPEESEESASPSPESTPSASGTEDPASSQPQSYSFTLEQLGVTVDPDPALIDAMNYSDQVKEARLNPENSGEGEDGGSALSTQTLSSEPTKDFAIEKTIDTKAIEDKINELAEESGWDVEPVASNFKVEKQKDEDTLSTWGELVETDPVDGYRIKTEDIISTIIQQVETGVYDLLKPGRVVPASTVAGEKKKYVKMASASTSFSGNSPEGRRFNIYKISDILNGAVLWPGEVFSVNDYVGPRNEENGGR
jgi:hypothetical protein